jgi:hypothetical protein
MSGIFITTIVRAQDIRTWRNCGFADARNFRAANLKATPEGRPQLGKGDGLQVDNSTSTTSPSQDFAGATGVATTMVLLRSQKGAAGKNRRPEILRLSFICHTNVGAPQKGGRPPWEYHPMLIRRPPKMFGGQDARVTPRSLAANSWARAVVDLHNRLSNVRAWFSKGEL